MKSTAAQDGIPLDNMDRFAAYKQLSQSQTSNGVGGEGKESGLQLFVELNEVLFCRAFMFVV